MALGSSTIEADRRVEVLRRAVDDAVQPLRTATLTLVSAALYLFVVGLGTSDRDLLLGRLIKLPIFDADVSLWWFYLLAPGAFIVLHFAVLSSSRLVALRLRRLQRELDRKEVPRPERDFVLGLLYPYPLVERLARLPAGRLIAAVLSLSVYAPMLIMPVFTLGWLQLRFLGYQDGWVTLWHVVLVFVDLFVIWAMWPRLARTPLLWTALGGILTCLSLVASLVLTVGLMSVTQPEWTSQYFKSDTQAHLDGRCALVGRLHLGWLCEYAKLDVPGETIAGPEQTDTISTFTMISSDELRTRLTTLSNYAHQKPEYFTTMVMPPPVRLGGAPLRRRVLRMANLMGASLIGADLTEADLTGADLRHADLRGAILEGAILYGAQLDYARLEVADLTNAKALGADFPFAEFQGAILHNTNFTGADLTGAHLKFTRFKDPEPRSADAAKQDEVMPPVFHGAILKAAQLQGTPVEGVAKAKWKIDARGADLRFTQLHGVDLHLFDLLGADLSGSSALPEDEDSRIYVCNNELVLADCGIPSHKRPNFSQLCYDAARVITVESWSDVGKKLEYLLKFSFSNSDVTAQCGGNPIAGSGDGTVSAAHPHETYAARNGGHWRPTLRGARDMLTHLERLEHSKPDWCSNSEPDRSNPLERALYMRAFTHRIIDYRCTYWRATESPVSGEKLETMGKQIFAKCNMSAPVFRESTCAGPIPKLLPSSQ